MLSVKPGKKYVVSTIKENGDITFKDVICECEFTNFGTATMEIKTTKGKFYPLYDVYNTREEALKDHLKNMKSTKTFLKKDIKKLKKEIEENIKRITEVDEIIKKIEKMYTIKRK